MRKNAPFTFYACEIIDWIKVATWIKLTKPNVNHRIVISNGITVATGSVANRRSQ